MVNQDCHRLHWTGWGKWLGFKDVDNCVFAPDERGAHYLADEEIVEELTVQQIVDIAAGG